MAQFNFNPLLGWADQHRNQLAGLGAGLLSGQPGAGVQAGIQADDAYATQQKAEAERARQIADQTALRARYADSFAQQGAPSLLVDMVRSGDADPAQTFWDLQKANQPGAAVDPTSTVGGRAQLAQTWGLQADEAKEYVLTGKLPGGNQSVRAGVGQPIFGRNKTTLAIEPWQSMTDGTMVNTANPQANPADYDFNPGIAAGSRAEGTVDAKTAGAARAALPGAEQAVNIANKATKAILDNTNGMAEQFGNTLGVPNQYIPDWAMAKGSPMANFRTLLSQGQGQAFVQARQMLKGQGQITDIESTKAEAAYSRMQMAAQQNNQDEFIQAVRDFQQAVNEGYDKLKMAANGAYATGQPAVTGNQGGNQTSTGVTWSVTP